MTGRGGVSAATGEKGADGGLGQVNLSPLSTAGVVLGKSVAVGAVSGVVYARAPHGTRRIRIGARVVLAVGSSIDARDGILKLTALRPGPTRHAARAAAATTETEAMSGGRFTVTQPSRGDGLVVTTLVGGTFAGCASPHRAHTAVGRKPAVRVPPVVRQLWSKDSGGNFSTHGRDSVGTVQGTWWLTADRCDGTLTSVVQGRVLVRAVRVRRRVLLHAGQSYLAPAAGR